MNQFKRAKQLRTESGQPTESITDLKTAGVAVKPETEKKSEIHNVIQEEIQDKAPINLPEKEPNLDEWKVLIDNIKNPKNEITVALAGKYTELNDAYIFYQSGIHMLYQ